MVRRLIAITSFSHLCLVHQRRGKEKGRQVQKEKDQIQVVVERQQFG
jgi:hypothetical protein